MEKTLKTYRFPEAGVLNLMPGELLIAATNIKGDEEEYTRRQDWAEEDEDEATDFIRHFWR